MNSTKIRNPIKKATQFSEKRTEENVRMNLNISKTFHKEIKQKALDEDTTVTELVVKALKEYLNR